MIQKRVRFSALTILIGLLFFVSESRSLVTTSKRGAWPNDWPAELEPLRERARSIGVATGIQQNIHEITFVDRETFERVWPVILALKTPGAPITLYKQGSASPSAWGSLLSNAAPAVRIYAPSGGYSGQPEPGVTPQQAIAQGKMLHAAPPWPKELYSEDGQLPEWVRNENVNGERRWIPATRPGEVVGFYYRARVELELVVDGQVIDLNRISLGTNTPVADKRFQ